jgi:hypothetical protein
MTYPERIRAWVVQQFQPWHVDRVTQDLIDVAAGNRDGNHFEREALDRIFPESITRLGGHQQRRATW